jgi:hypothetical protein
MSNKTEPLVKNAGTSGHAADTDQAGAEARSRRHQLKQAQMELRVTMDLFAETRAKIERLKLRIQALRAED